MDPIELAAVLEDMSFNLKFSAVSWGLSYGILLGVLAYKRQWATVGIGVAIVVALALVAGNL